MKPQAAIRKPAASTAFPGGSRWLAIALSLTVGALILRALVLPLAPKYGYWGDHDDFVRWGIQATDKGILSLYDKPPARWDNLGFERGQWRILRRQMDRLCNYPPGAAYWLYASGAVFKAVSADRLINTLTSRTVFAVPSIVADVLLAAGCAAIVALYRPGRPVWWTYAIVLFMPPFWLDSALWGQVDSTLLAPMVWMLWAMLSGRWTLAGVLFGLAAMLKPQAILLVPVWGWAVLFNRPVRKPLTGLAAATGTVLVIAMPFLLHSGFAWFKASYVENMLAAHPETTMKAFNIWYVDLLLRESYDVHDRLLGISRDNWGKILLLTTLAVGFAVLALRRRREPAVLLWWTAWILLAAVMLPTRVHERYLLIPLPPLLIGSLLVPRLRAPVIALAIVAAAQVTWQLWMPVGPGDWQRLVEYNRPQYDAWLAQLPPDQVASAAPFEQVIAPDHERFLRNRARTAPYEWFLTALALVASAWTWVSLGRSKGTAPSTSPATRDSPPRTSGQPHPRSAGRA